MIVLQCKPAFKNINVYVDLTYMPGLKTVESK